MMQVHHFRTPGSFPYSALQGHVTLVFIAAILLSFIGFILLVITVITPSHTWTVLLIVVVSAGLMCFLVDVWQKSKTR